MFFVYGLVVGAATLTTIEYLKDYNLADVVIEYVVNPVIRVVKRVLGFGKKLF